MRNGWIRFVASVLLAAGAAWASLQHRIGANEGRSRDAQGRAIKNESRIDVSDERDRAVLRALARIEAKVDRLVERKR